MSEAKTGDTVRVHYTGTLADGTQFDSSRGGQPLELTLGAGMVIPGFENAVLGMSSGESKSVAIPVEDAYGPRRAELAQEAPRSAIPDHITLAVGMMLHAQGPQGQQLTFQVTDFDDETVTLDGNHPLAGQDLIFELELVEIV
jgi:FKBP-type peptidyl-prolyl cis-trans isomerase 2